MSKLNQVNAQIEEVKELIWKCKIYNPVKGTVLQKYTEVYELVMPGKALYKIADMSQMELKVYVDGAQLPNIKIGQLAKVFIDKDEDVRHQAINALQNLAEINPDYIPDRSPILKALKYVSSVCDVVT